MHRCSTSISLTTSPICMSAMRSTKRGRLLLVMPSSWQSSVTGLVVLLYCFVFYSLAVLFCCWAVWVGVLFLCCFLSCCLSCCLAGGFFFFVVCFVVWVVLSVLVCFGLVCFVGCLFIAWRCKSHIFDNLTSISVSQRYCLIYALSIHPYHLIITSFLHQYCTNIATILHLQCWHVGQCTCWNECDWWCRHSLSEWSPHVPRHCPHPLQTFKGVCACINRAKMNLSREMRVCRCVLMCIYVNVMSWSVHVSIEPWWIYREICMCVNVTVCNVMYVC